MPAHEALLAALGASFADLTASGEVDIAPLEDEDAAEVQADAWTLYVQGWPVRTAWIALDDDPASRRDERALLADTLGAAGLGALRILAAATDGTLVTALRASGDPLSATLAALIEQPADS